MATVVTEYRFRNPVSEEQLSAISRDLDPVLARLDASWQRSYVSDDRLRMICEFEAKNEKSVTDAHLEVSVPFEAVWSAKRWTLEEMKAEQAHERIEQVKEADETKRITRPEVR
jgi:hypothetical protein